MNLYSGVAGWALTVTVAPLSCVVVPIDSVLLTSTVPPAVGFWMTVSVHTRLKLAVIVALELDATVVDSEVGLPILVPLVAVQFRNL